MTTATGIISWQAQASAFGDTKIDMQIASTRLAAENNHRFPGQYYDTETGLHQNYFRDYEASIGRYVQRDPIGLNGGINVFGYVGAGPIGFVDPLGLFSVTAYQVKNGYRYRFSFSFTCNVEMISYYGTKAFRSRLKWLKRAEDEFNKKTSSGENDVPEEDLCECWNFDAEFRKIYERKYPGSDTLTKSEAEDLIDSFKNHAGRHGGRFREGDTTVKDAYPWDDLIDLANDRSPPSLF
jgi:RHS repeat-associated protein